MIAARKTRTAIEQANFDAIDAEVEWIARELGARGMHFPVLIGRESLERAGYHESFPHLLMSATTCTNSWLAGHSFNRKRSRPGARAFVTNNRRHLEFGRSSSKCARLFAWALRPG
jgi:hypothetical protein